MELPSEFFELHKDLPREGPGDAESLAWALSFADLPADARMLDAGCGPGADIADLLAHAPGGHVTAIDAYAPFVAQARAAHGSDPRVLCDTADMAAPPGGPFDLIWCAGALYFLGVEDGLRGWRDHLKPGGIVAFSEPIFFTPAPSAAAKAFWDGYPAGDREAIVRAIEAAGYRLLADRPLPGAAWEAYFQPLAKRIAALEDGALPALEAVLAENRTEIANWRKLRRETGYGQFVVQKQEP